MKPGSVVRQPNQCSTAKSMFHSHFGSNQYFFIVTISHAYCGGLQALRQWATTVSFIVRIDCISFQVATGFINARLEDDTPIFNKQRINFTWVGWTFQSCQDYKLHTILTCYPVQQVLESCGLSLIYWCGVWSTWQKLHCHNRVAFCMSFESSSHISKVCPRH